MTGLPCILLVDDEPDILELVCVRLSAKYHVVTACNGREAYEVMKKENPQVIVCDVVMPEMDGLSFCRKVRSEGLSVPILFVTAKGQAQDIVEVLSAGGDDYIVKPFEPGELMARIGAILRRIHPADAA